MHLFTFVFISITLVGIHRGSCFDLCLSVLPTFYSKSFIVCSLTFRSLIHFEFIFVHGVRKCSNFLLLDVTVQFFQHHLLKRLYIAPLYSLASFVKNKVPICAWIYFWAFYLVPLVYISVFFFFFKYPTFLMTVAL